MKLLLYPPDDNSPFLHPLEVAERLVKSELSVSVDWGHANAHIQAGLERLLLSGAPSMLVDAHKKLFDNCPFLQISAPSNPDVKYSCMVWFDSAIELCSDSDDHTVASILCELIGLSLGYDSEIQTAICAFSVHQEYSLSQVRNQLAHVAWDEHQRIAYTQEDVYWFAFRGSEGVQSDFLGPRAALWTAGETVTSDSEKADSDGLVLARELGLPDLARKAFDSQPQQTQHIFLCETASDSAFYAGQAELENLSPGYVPFELLDGKLPKPVWLRFGGFDGWFVQIDGRQHTVKAGHLEQFALLLNELDMESGHLFLANYEECLLTIHFNADCAWPTWSGWFDGDYHQDLTLKNINEDAADEWFECSCCGIPVSTKISETLAHSEAIRLAHQVFRVGHALQWDWRIR